MTVRFLQQSRSPQTQLTGRPATFTHRAGVTRPECSEALPYGPNKRTTPSPDPASTISETGPIAPEAHSSYARPQCPRHDTGPFPGDAHKSVRVLCAFCLFSDSARSTGRAKGLISSARSGARTRTPPEEPGGLGAARNVRPSPVDSECACQRVLSCPDDSTESGDSEPVRRVLCAFRARSLQNDNSVTSAQEPPTPRIGCRRAYRSCLSK